MLEGFNINTNYQNLSFIITIMIDNIIVMIIIIAR